MQQDVIQLYDDFTHQLGFTENALRQVFRLGGFARDDIGVYADVLPGMALLRKGLISTLIAEKLFGGIVRWLIARAIRSQRKGPPQVATLRLVVVARKAKASA